INLNQQPKEKKAEDKQEKDTEYPKSKAPHITKTSSLNKDEEIDEEDIDNRPFTDTIHIIKIINYKDASINKFQKSKQKVLEDKQQEKNKQITDSEVKKEIRNKIIKDGELKKTIRQSRE